MRIIEVDVPDDSPFAVVFTKPDGSVRIEVQSPVAWEQGVGSAGAERDKRPSNLQRLAARMAERLT